MNIIFLGTTGVHHALVAANIYVGHLKDKKYYILKDYANLHLELTGFPIFIGKDKQGNRVYSLGAGKDLAIAKKMIEEFTIIMGYSKSEMLVKPVSIYGEKLLALVSTIPEWLGGRLWSSLLASIIIKSQLPAIKRDIEEFSRKIIDTEDTENYEFFY